MPGGHAPRLVPKRKGQRQGRPSLSPAKVLQDPHAFSNEELANTVAEPMIWVTTVLPPHNTQTRKKELGYGEKLQHKLTC